MFLPVKFVSLLRVEASFLTRLVLLCLHALKYLDNSYVSVDSFTPTYVMDGVVAIGQKNCVWVVFQPVFVDVNEVFISFRDHSRTLSSVDRRRVNNVGDNVVFTRCFASQAALLWRYDGFAKLWSKVISTRSLLNEWAFCAHAYRISKFINKGESHDKNVAKSIRGGAQTGLFLYLRVRNKLFLRNKRCFSVSLYSRC